MKFISHIGTAIRILEQYKGREPFGHFIKHFFSQEKKYGSRDRKTISHLCYCYFRLGHSLKEATKEERILTALFLCNQAPNEMLAHFKHRWNEAIGMSTQEKCSLINFPVTDIFPWKNELSDGIDHNAFCTSFLQQPDLFIRIRPGFESTVRKKLTQSSIPFTAISPSCLAFANATKLEATIALDKEAVIQDYSSQRTQDLMELSAGSRIKAWDCCAASGGKSILLHDLHPDIDLTVSDIRESILINLKKRFNEAGITRFSSFIADLSATSPIIPHFPFDIIMADLPCTGSGTWSRNPEALYYFRESEIARYSALQKKIISNILPHLKKGGALVYITCSVFKKENEEAVDYIRETFQLGIEKMGLFKGYDQKADTMFGARLIA